MREILMQARPLARRLLIGGAAVCLLLAAASAFFYFGAGRWLDYYPAVARSEALLTAVRPLAVAAAAASLAAEYYGRKREDDIL